MSSERTVPVGVFAVMLIGMTALAIVSSMGAWNGGRSQGRAEQEAKDKANAPTCPHLEVSKVDSMTLVDHAGAVTYIMEGVHLEDRLKAGNTYFMVPDVPAPKPHKAAPKVPASDCGGACKLEGAYPYPFPVCSKSNGTEPCWSDQPRPREKQAANVDEFAHCKGHLDPIGPDPKEGDDVDMDPVNCTIKVRVPKAEDQ